MAGAPVLVGPNGRRQIAIAGHLGEFVQGRLGPDGPVALLTLPCPALRLHGLWHPGAFALHQPGRPVLAPGQVTRLLQALGLPMSGRFTLRADMPLGGGAGSSTAALVAVARLAGHPVSFPADLARATVAVEGASDPLMFADPAQVLWASRAGQIVTPLPTLPPIEVLGGFYGPPRRTDPRDSDFPDISDLALALPMAMRSAAALADLACESARRALGRFAGGKVDPTDQLARDLGALGFAIGHTGPARALIFAPGTVPPQARAHLHKAGFRGLVQFRPSS